jgi:hypothetical protein
MGVMWVCWYGWISWLWLACPSQDMAWYSLVCLKIEIPVRKWFLLGNDIIRCLIMYPLRSHVVTCSHLCSAMSCPDRYLCAAGGTLMEDYNTIGYRRVDSDIPRYAQCEMVTCKQIKFIVGRWDGQL